jgi:hypothetical protein
VRLIFAVRKINVRDEKDRGGGKEKNRNQCGPLFKRRKFREFLCQKVVK